MAPRHKYELEALQDPRELEEFVALVKAEGVRSYLEIGSKHGGSLWAVANAMPPGSFIVSIDLEAGQDLRECIAALRLRLYRVELIKGNSTDPKVIEAAARLAPFDLCLIDANHTEPFVRMDWKNYGPLARIVAFHDIAWNLGNRPPRPWRIDVPKVWNEIKNGYRFREIKLCHTGRDNGLGVLWR